MSYNTLAAMVVDDELRARVNACLQQEARQPVNIDTPQGQTVIAGVLGVLDNFMWWVADATEAEYASAVAAGNEHPGSDESVVTDQAILSAVQAAWTTVLGDST